jgi:RimJ/RimL family protein N-acetyltransferase
VIERWPYRIETDRLVIRPWDPAEAPVLHAMASRNLDRLAPWMAWAAGGIQSIDEMAQLLRRWRAAVDLEQELPLGVFLPDGTAIGATGLHVRNGPDSHEIGYWIDADREGRGYVTEWTGALTRVAIELLGDDRVEIHHQPDNLRSRGVPARLGFADEGVLSRRYPHPDGRQDTRIWSMYAGKLAASPAGAVRYRAFDVLGRQIAPPVAATGSANG